MRCTGASHQASSLSAFWDGDARIVTFSNGNIARELLVDLDDKQRRLAYAVKSKRVSHYSASLQVSEEYAERCRLVWIVDVLPTEIADYIRDQMDNAIVAMRATLERR